MRVKRLSLTVLLLSVSAWPAAQAPPPFDVHEASIRQIHDAMKAGRLTCRGAGRAVSPPHRRVRQERAGDQCHRDHESGGVEAGRRDGSALQAGRSLGPAPLHPDHRQRQLRNDRAAERQRLARARRVRVEQGCVPGPEDQGGRRDRDRQVEHGRVGVHAERDAQLDPARLHEESLRARSRHRGIERRHRGRGGGQLRHRRPRQRHRQLDPRARHLTRRWPAFDRRWD